MSHLGDRVAALVDDQLPSDVRERLLAHVAGCSQCRREVEAARELKQRLTALSSPQPSPRLTERLVSMSEPGEPMPAERSAMPWGWRPRPVPGGWGTAPPSQAADSHTAVAPAGHAPGRGTSDAASGRARRLRRVAAAAVSVSAATLGVAFVVGGEGERSVRPVVPPVEQFVVEHAATSSDVPLTEPAVSAVTVDHGVPTTPWPVSPLVEPSPR